MTLTAQVTGVRAGPEQIFPAGQEKHSVEAAGEYYKKSKTNLPCKCFSNILVPGRCCQIVATQLRGTKRHHVFFQNKLIHRIKTDIAHF